MRPPIIFHIVSLCLWVYVIPLDISGQSHTDTAGLIKDQLGLLTEDEKNLLRNDLLEFYAKKGIRIKILSLDQPAGKTTLASRPGEEFDLAILVTRENRIRFIPSGKFSDRFSHDVTAKIYEKLALDLEKKETFKALQKSVFASMSVLTSEPDTYTGSSEFLKIFSDSVYLNILISIALFAGAVSGLWLALIQRYVIYDSSGPKTRYSSRPWANVRSGRMKREWQKNGAAGQWHS